VEALKCYKLADKSLREFEQHEVEPYQKGLVRQHKAQVFNQVALCYSQLGDHEKVVEFSTKVIQSNVDKGITTKALLRRGAAHEVLD